jgi:putative chitinase
MFKGRGYVQLTGRDNYTRIGHQIGEPLATQPELANDPSISGIVLAQFLKNRENTIRAALAAGNLRLARKLVNGGSHGLARFADTYNRGLAVLPG